MRCCRSGVITRELVPLQPSGKLRQRANAGRLGFEAPLLETVEQCFAIASVAFGQRCKTCAEFADGAQLRVIFGESSQALARGGIEPAAAVAESLAQLARQRLDAGAGVRGFFAQCRRDDTAEIVAH